MGQEGATTVPLRLGRPLSFPLWTIPAAYVAASVTAGVVIPRLEQAWLPNLGHPMSAPAALAAFATVASGSMAFTGMVFAVAFIAVQFSAVAYSPRLVVMFANAPRSTTRSGCSSRPSPTAWPPWPGPTGADRASPR